MSTVHGDSTAVTTAATARELRRILWIVVVLVALWAAFRLATGIVLEDALITFRYACNLAHGAGLVFNPGERVLGTTTPLFALVLGAVASLAGCLRLPLAACLIGIAAQAGALVLTFAALRRLGAGRRTASIALVLLGLHPLLLWATTGGMETPLVLLGMAAGLYALAAERPWLAGLACGLLVLARPDGVVWSTILAGAFALRHRRAGNARRLVGAGLLALLIVLPWLLFAWSTFGSPLPHSVVAKRVIAADLPAGGVHAFDRPGWFLGGVVLPYPYIDHAFEAAGFAAWGAATLLWLFAWTAGFAAWRGNRDARLFVLPVFWAADVLFLLLGRAPLGFDWYLAPLLWASLVWGACGAASLWRGARGSTSRRWALGIGGSFLALHLLASFGLAWRDQRLQQEQEDGLRRAVGERLRDTLPASASVATEAIGYIGYYSERRVIDLAGLVSPEVVRIRAASASNGEAFARVLSELRPDAVVLRSYEVERNRHFHGGKLFETPEARQEFDRHYRVAARFEGPHPELWGRLGRLTIYRRVEDVPGD